MGKKSNSRWKREDLEKTPERPENQILAAASRNKALSQDGFKNLCHIFRPRRNRFEKSVKRKIDPNLRLSMQGTVSSFERWRSGPSASLDLSSIQSDDRIKLLGLIVQYLRYNTTLEINIHLNRRCRIETIENSNFVQFEILKFYGMRSRTFGKSVRRSLWRFTYALQDC